MIDWFLGIRLAHQDRINNQAMPQIGAQLVMTERMCAGNEAHGFELNFD